MHGIVQLCSGFSCITKRFVRGAASYASYDNSGYRTQITLTGPDKQSHTGYVQDVRDDAVWVRFSGSRPAAWIPKSQLSESDRQDILDLDKIVYQVKDPRMQRRMEKLTACETLQAVQGEVKLRDDVAFVGISGSTITLLRSRTLPWSGIMQRLERHYDEKMEEAKEIDPSKACTGDGIHVVLDQSQLDCGYIETRGFTEYPVYHEHVDREFIQLIQRSVTPSTKILVLRSLRSDRVFRKILGSLKKLNIQLDTLVLQDSTLFLDEYVEIVDWPRHYACDVPGNLPARTLALRNVTLGNILTGLMFGRAWKFQKKGRGGIPRMDVELVITNDHIPTTGNGFESRPLIECFERYCPELPADMEEQAQTEWARLTTWKPSLAERHTPSTSFAKSTIQYDIEDLRQMLQWFEGGQRHFSPDISWATVDLQTIHPKALRRLTWRAVVMLFAKEHARKVEEYGEDRAWDPHTRTWDLVTPSPLARFLLTD